MKIAELRLYEESHLGLCRNAFQDRLNFAIGEIKAIFPDIMSKSKSPELKAEAFDTMLQNAAQDAKELLRLSSQIREIEDVIKQLAKLEEA